MTKQASFCKLQLTSDAIIFTISTLPISAENSRVVFPSLLAMFISQPALINNFIIEACLFEKSKG